MRPALALAEDPSGRTKVIHGYRRLHGDLTEAARALEAAKTDPAAADFRAGLCAALGLIPWKDISAEERAALRKAMVELYTDAPDGRTHSAAYFAMKRWEQEDQLPTLRGSSLREADDLGWFVNKLDNDDKLDMTMTRIPKGSFWMGDESRLALRREKPRHKVTLTNDFFLADRPVTVRQFKEFVRQVADVPEATDEEKEIAENWGGQDEEVSPDLDCPVQRVSWFEAVAFCNWLSRREGLTPCYRLTKTGPDGRRDWQCDLVEEGKGYRLPNEAQWEYACRAVSQTQYAFGDDERLLGEYAWYATNTSVQTWPAGDKLPNGWGLFDMHGNVFEWCQDWYADDYYAESPPRDPLGPDVGSLRVIRGGSWWNVAGNCRAAYRSRDEPQYRYVRLGFRVAAVPLSSSSQEPAAEPGA